MTPRTAMWLWVGTRAFLIVSLMTFQLGILGDVQYYFRNLSSLSSLSELTTVMPEYPVPILGILAAPALLAGKSALAYSVLFVLMMLAADAYLSRTLWRLGSPLPLLVWSAGLVALGPIVYARYDMVPTVFVGLVILSLAGGLLYEKHRGKGALAGGLLAAGVAVKVWPIALLPALLTRRATARRLIAGFTITGLAILVLSLPFGGPLRILAPFLHQETRGLQVESIWATPAIMANTLQLGEYDIGMIHFAVEISGPGTGILQKLATLSIGLAGIFILALCWRTYSRKITGMLPLLIAVIIMLVIVTNKVFSPQYMLWLLAPVAILAARPERAARLLAAHVVGIMALTQLVFPHLYLWIAREEYTTTLGGLASNTILLTRNMWMVVITLLVCRYAWQATAERLTVAVPERRASEVSV